MSDPRDGGGERVLSPSDLAAASTGARVRVGGRVAERGEGSLVLRDAFARVAVDLAARADVAIGDLVVVEGDARAGRVLAASLVERTTPRRPPSLAPRRDPDAPFPNESARLASGVGDALAARARAYAAIRAWFSAERFLEVETPAMVPCPGLDLHLDAFGVADTARWLITSPEYQMKRLLAGGVPRCFQLARCFRRGEIGGRHNPEFTMLEWYRAFAGVDEIIADTEALVRAAATALGRGDALIVNGRRVDLAQPFARISVGEAFARWAGVSANEAIALATADEDRFFRLLVDQVEPALEREPAPVFLVDYPAPFASLARLKPSDPRVCERFELYAGGVELCNGFGELTDPVEQRARFERDQAARRAERKPVYPIDERFVAALEEGMPRAAGNAMGLDRLVAVCRGEERIGDVLAFPEGWV